MAWWCSVNTSLVFSNKEFVPLRKSLEISARSDASPLQKFSPPESPQDFGMGDVALLPLYNFSYKSHTLYLWVSAEKYRTFRPGLLNEAC
jgi:hypothetical protein